MEPIAQLGGTRSSYRWQEMPGNWDRLNTRALFPSSNEWGIPDLPQSTHVPTSLVAYNDRHAIAKAVPGSAVHFFLDDYRFETVWTKPERAISRLQNLGHALTPDFSMWRDMPKVMQIWQVYRSRWCGLWMRTFGIEPIPTVGWAAWDSYDFAFAGIPHQSVVAVSTVGLLRDKEALGFFVDGFDAMMDEIMPSTVLVYGHYIASVMDGRPVRMFETRWKARK